MRKPKATTEATAVATEQPKTRTTRAKKTPNVEVVPPVVEAITEAPRRPSRPKRTPAPNPEPAAVETAPEKPASRKRAPKPKPTQFAWNDPEGRIEISFRPVTRREATPQKPAAVSAKPIRGGQKPAAVAIPALPEITTPPNRDELVILQWRAAGTAASIASGAAAPEAEEEARSSTRRSRRRGRGKLVTAADALVPDSEREEPKQARPERPQRARAEKTPRPEPVVSKEPEPPAKPKREPVRIPANAPQVIQQEGHALLVRDGKVIPPIFFFGAASDQRRSDNVFEEIRLAHEHGVSAFIHYVEFIVDPARVEDAVGVAAFLLDKTVSVNPDSQVMFRLVFTAPNDWEKRYPGAAYANAQGELAEPSICHDEFWEVAAECLASFSQQLMRLPNAGNILGLHIERGEWFFANGQGYDTSAASLTKFREWLRMRYSNDTVALRAAWFDGKVTFDNVLLPKYNSGKAEDFVRTGRKQRRWVDTHLFLSDATVERISSLAYAVKKATDGMFLVGVSYGYTFEWDHAASGHLSLGKLLRTPEVDIIAGPPSYKNRLPGGTCPFPCPIDSFALNGKLYISEEDFKTPISSGQQEPDDFNPTIRTPQALESVQWRGAGAALAHSSGICWMDIWGNGWLNTPGIWQRAELVREALLRARIGQATNPDVAVFIDERSLAYLADAKAFGLLVQNVRESVLRSGLSAGFYLLSDLAHRENFPECKVHIFVNAWDIRPEVRSAIKSRLQRDGKVLFWMYAAGVFDSGRDALERVREVTGIALKPQPYASRSGSTVLNRRHPLCEAIPDRDLAAGSQLEPSYFAIPENAIVLGEYSQTGLPSYVIREFDGAEQTDGRWTSVFLGEPVMTPALVRALGDMAGAPAWNYHDDVVHVRPPFLTVHCTKPGPRAITLPDKWAAYNVGTHEWAALDQTHLRFTAMDGMTYVFAVGPRSELDAMLNRNLDELLIAPAIPDRPENTIDYDHLNFEVPIMKLGEWMEEGWTEELADDLLLKPSQIEVDLPEELSDLDERVSPGTRRRRRRRRGSQDRRPGEVSEPIGELGMSVVFRKRE
ncbi:MAG: hypothetical protein JNM85_10115 [Chthonomonas sp.]|nr:hypothetical protein [Chthonomonas sp.]